MRRIIIALIGLALLFAVPGCGEDEGEGGGEDAPVEAPEATEGNSPESDLYDTAYDAARTSCADDGVEALASALGVEASPETVAEAYAKDVADPGDAQDGSRDGCLAGFEDSPE